MKVLIVHPLGLRFAGYPYIEEKVRALAAHDVEIAVVAPFKDETTMVDGRPPSFARIPLAFDKRGWMTREARRAITRFEPDVIHVWTPRALPSRIALEARVATGADVIVNYEDPEHLHFEQAEGPFRSRDVLAPLEKANPTPDDIGRFLRDMPWDWVLGTLRAPFATPFLHPLFFGLLNQSAAGFTGIWTPWVDLLARRFERPSLLMPLAVDLARLQPPSAAAIAASRDSLGLAPDALLLLRAGVLYGFVDDQEPMLEGYAAFLRTHPSARLVMCGHNYQEGRIAAALERFGITDKVRWLGFLDAPDYQALLHAADVTLCPGYPDEYNRFRLAGKIVEYMIAGRPMICYASGIGEDLVDGRDALLLDPYTPEQVERQLLRAADPELRRALGTRARALAGEWFDVVPLAARMAAFYRTCVADAARAIQAGVAVPRLAINLASAADRFRGGTGTFVDGLLDGLARMRDAVDVVIVASPSAAASGAWLRPGVAWHQEIVVEPAASSFGFASLGDADAIAALVRRLGIDVWFTPHTLPAPAVLPCATVAAILDVQHEDLPELYAPRERARRALVYETIARTSTRVVTLSAFSRDRIAARYALDPSRIDVVPLGPPAWAHTAREAAPAAATPYVLCPATTWRHKNHVTLIDALARVRATGIALDLVLTGLEGEAHADVMARIAGHGLGPHVTWLGHVDEARLRALYDGALAVAVPSRYEGFGLPVVEAMARGVPVVIADAASLPEVGGDAVLRVPALAAAAWADALGRLAGDPALCERLREAGRAQVARFSMDIAAERLWASASRAAGEGPRGVAAPLHVGPDRSFRGCSRYYVQAPSAGTLEVRGTTGTTASWTMTCVTTPNGGPAARLAREGTGAFAASWPVAEGPASLELTIDTSLTPATLSGLALHLTSGVVLDMLPSLTIGGPEETLDESLARAVVRLHALAGRGLRRVALYGAGSHSRLLLARLAGGPCTVVAVIDDAPAADRFEDLPLVPPAQWAGLDADALVLSSRGAEPELAARAAAWLPAGVPLVRLHTDESRA